MDKTAPRQGKRDGPGEKKPPTAPAAGAEGGATAGSGARGDRDANRRRGGFNNDERCKNQTAQGRHLTFD